MIKRFRAISILTIVAFLVVLFLQPLLQSHSDMAEVRSQSLADDTETHLFPVSGGYINRAGELVIKLDGYHEEFHEGLAEVWHKNGKIGYIDKTGKYVIEPVWVNAGEYDDDMLGERHFSEGLAIASEEYEIKEDGETYTSLKDIGYIDKTGEVVIRIDGYILQPFSEGLASALYLPDPHLSYTSEQKFGFIDRQGNVAIEPKFTKAESFSEGLAAVGVGEWGYEKWGFIDKSGNFTIAPEYAYAKSFFEGLAAVAVAKDDCNVVYGYVDKTGEMVISPQFSDAENFSEGLAAVVVGKEEEQKWGYIDKSGKFVIEPQFERDYGVTAGLFSEGLAVITVKKTVQSSEEQFGLFFSDESGQVYKTQYGFIDRSGKWVIEPKYDYAEGFKDGLARVSMYDPDFIGYIDRTGQLVWPRQTK
jgi:hypothetical protein